MEPFGTQWQSLINSREALRDAVLANTARILDQIPRDVEFTYNRKMDKLKPLMKSSLVPFSSLLENLHLPKVHVEVKKPKCFFHCNQKQSCHRIRETLGLVHILVEELGRRNRVFEGINVSMIGSVREGTRTFYHDEVDVHLALSEEYKQFTYFDVRDQALKRKWWTGWRRRPFDGYFGATSIFRAKKFKAEKFFFDFVSSVHSIISTMEMPNGFTMLPLTTSFNPCTRCMTTRLGRLQVMRCRHKPDCEQHKRCKCKEPSKCECLDMCECREYASPSITWSKVGVVLHLQWREKDGTLCTIDCDMNCPT